MDERVAVLLARRSVREFTDDPVRDAEIKAMLEAGMAAPSARALDPWRFVVVTDRATLDRLAETHPYGKMLGTAGACIAVCGDTALAPDFWVQDCSAATENILVAASMLGLGTCWLGVHPRDDRERSLKELLGVPENVGMLCLIAVGSPKLKPEPRTRYDAAKVCHGRWS